MPQSLEMCRGAPGRVKVGSILRVPLPHLPAGRFLTTKCRMPRKQGRQRRHEYVTDPVVFGT